MSFQSLTQLFSLRDLRSAVLGTIVVFGGIALALLTLVAHRTGNASLAGIAAVASLVFVVLILIFVLPPLARNASKEASQLNLPFELTLGGAIMLGLIAIVGFSAWNTGNNLLFLILAFLSSAVIIAFVAGTITLKKLDVKMRFPEAIFAGEETEILVSVNNRKRFVSSYSVVVDVRGKEREESFAADELRKLFPRFIAERLARAPIKTRTLNYFIHLKRNATTEETASHVFENRGCFLIKDFELSTRFPFAFFRHRRRLPARETNLLVFPKIQPLTSEIDDLQTNVGSLATTRRGAGQDLLTLREYLPNDDLRKVDWKATARSRSLIVREFAAEDDRKITILLDPCLPEAEQKPMTIRDKIEAEQTNGPGIRSERFESGVSLTASLLSHFTEQQAEVRFVIGNKAGEFGVGRRHLIECLKLLAVAEPSFKNAGGITSIGSVLYSLSRGEETGEVFVITAFPDIDLGPETANPIRVLTY